MIRFIEQYCDGLLLCNTCEIPVMYLIYYVKLTHLFTLN